MVFWLVGGWVRRIRNAVFGFDGVSLPLVVQASVESIPDAGPAGSAEDQGLIQPVGLRYRDRGQRNHVEPEQDGRQRLATVSIRAAGDGEALFNGPLVARTGRRRAFWGSSDHRIPPRDSVSVGECLHTRCRYSCSWSLGVAARDIRTAVTGLWYNDWNRLAAMLPVMAVPLATLGKLIVIRAAGCKRGGQRGPANARRAIPADRNRPRCRFSPLSSSSAHPGPIGSGARKNAWRASPDVGQVGAPDSRWSPSSRSSAAPSQRTR